MARIEIDFRPQGDVLREFMESDARVQLIRGPLGSAKTATCAYKVFDLACRQPPNDSGVRPSRWAIVRNTYPDLRSSTIRDWREMFGDEFGSFAWSSPPEHQMRFALPDGTRVEADILFIALDRDDDVRKIRGTNLTGLWFNEVKEIPKSLVDMADGRHGRYPTKLAGGVECGWHGMLGDYNSPDEDHWLYRLAEVDRPEGWAFFRQPGGVFWDGDAWVPNPEAENLQNLPDGYYARQIAAKDHDWIKVNLANEYGFVQEGKPVYPDFGDSFHVHPEIPPDKHLPLLLGWDFGLTPAVVIGQLSPRGQLRILEEMVAEDMGITRFARDVVKPRIQSRYAGFQVGLSWADPAGSNRSETDERTAIGILNDQYGGERLDMGFFTEPAPTNVPTARIEAVNSFLTKVVDQAPGFLLDASCRYLRKGFNGAYSYRRVQIAGQERYHDKPDKGPYSHPHDALQYLALAAQGGRVMQDDDEPFHERPVGASATTGY